MDLDGFLEKYGEKGLAVLDALPKTYFAGDEPALVMDAFKSGIARREQARLGAVADRFTYMLAPEAFVQLSKAKKALKRV